MLLGTQAFAQISVGAGYLNSTESVKSGSNKSSDNVNGFYAGASYNIPLVGELGVAPGLYFSLLSGKQDIASVGSLAAVKGTFTEMALNIPVNFNYGYNLAPDMRAFVFAGPTFQYGLSSKVKYDATTIVGNASKTVDNYGDNSDYGRFNVYLGGGVGMDIASTFQVTVGYDYGLVNLYTGDNDIQRHRSNIKIGVAYLF